MQSLNIFFVIIIATVLNWIISTPVQSAEVKLSNGINIHYETAGQGNIPVILVHGYSMSSAVWERVMPILSKEYLVYAIDMRGFGQSDKPKSGYSCDELADDIKLFMDALAIPKAVLVGHSFGGLVIQHFAERYPKCMLGLVISNSFSATLQPKGISQAVEKRIKGYGTKEQNQKIFLEAITRYFDAANVTKEDVAKFLEINHQADNNALRETLKSNYSTPAISKASFAPLFTPVLIIVTTHDPYGTFDQAVSIGDSFRNSQIYVISRCGHTPMWEIPGEFGFLVTQFLERFKQ